MGVRARVLVVCIVLCSIPADALRSQSASQPDDAITKLVYGIEAAIRAGDAVAFESFVRPGAASAQLSEFIGSLTSPRPTSATVKERDRAQFVSGRMRLMLEILTVYDREALVTAWRVDVVPGVVDGTWFIADAERLTTISGLYRLTLDTTVEYAIHDLVISAPDLTITVPSGHAFAASTPDGPTAFVVLGRGHATLAPAPESERGQMRLFTGDDVFRSQVSAMFVRLNPADVANRITQRALTPEPADPRRARRAMQVFTTYAPKSFSLDLNDLSTEQWWLIPPGDDFVAELDTPKYGSLTYARASAEAEDISFFDRRRKRNIAVYASKEKLAARGPFFSEDDRLDYDVRNYDLDVGFAPERDWVDGLATVSIRTRNPLTTLTLRLAEPLVIRSITSKQFGRLLHLRVIGQNNVLVGFPGVVPGGTDVDLVITYGGRLPPQGIDREALQVQQDVKPEDIIVPIEPQYLYSNRSYWYPQGPVTDYATATMTITAPGGYDVVASGAPQGPPETLPSPPGQRARRKFVFVTSKPARYLSALISRFQASPPQTVKVLDDRDPIPVFVVSNPRAFARVRSMADKASDVLRFYASLVGDMPYDTFTLALTESDLPGGHSPAYFAMVNQPLPMTRYSWTNDPVSFPNFPSFFVAHEIAHQWWGQAVGWKNYHEQWLSEGFAQYFAALYAEHERGSEAFTTVLRQMRRTAIDASPQGPVYLGYRLGHLKGDARVFRALVYNKGALVLHMLRRLVGDEAFFSGLREFYATWRYKKTGTDDLRASMEKATGRKLERFFDRWIYSSGIPTLRMTSSLSSGTLRVRFDQSENVYDVPVTVSLSYADGRTEDVVVAVTERTVERAIPLTGTLRSFDVNRDGAALAEILR